MVHIDLTPAAEVGFMLLFVAVPFVALLFLFRSLGNHGKRKMEANGLDMHLRSGRAIRRMPLDKDAVLGLWRIR